MRDGISYVGLDVHQDSISVSVLAGGSEEALEFEVGGDDRGVGKLIRRLKKLARERRVECVYEAGPCGYALQRRLESAGMGCAVVAPSLIPVKEGDRIKTNRRDARKLAEQHRAGIGLEWEHSAERVVFGDYLQAIEHLEERSWPTWAWFPASIAPEADDAKAGSPSPATATCDGR